MKAGDMQSPVKIIIGEGLAYHVIGRMKDSAQAEDNLRRVKRMESDAEFCERVLTQEGLPGLEKRLDRGEYTDDDPAGQSGVRGVYIPQYPPISAIRALTTPEKPRFLCEFLPVNRLKMR